VNWTLDPPAPVLTVTAGQWDEGGNETPAVVSFGGKYHMFWTGYPDAWPPPPNASLHFRIGHATSTDGISWTKDASFLLGPSGVPGDFAEFIVGEPGPVVFNNTLYLYFTAVGVDAGLAASLQVVGVMTSADGLSGWTQDPAPIRRLTDFPWTQREIRSPGAFLDGTTLRLYFAGDDLVYHGRVGHRTDDLLAGAVSFAVRNLNC